MGRAALSPVGRLTGSTCILQVLQHDECFYRAVHSRMMRHTCRAAALTFFGVAFGSCQPEAANVERIRRLELENDIETTAGGRYFTVFW